MAICLWMGRSSTCPSTNKIISLPQTFYSYLVGFKLEHTDNIDYLFERANLRMAASNAEFMVANKTGSLYGEEAEHYIVSKFQTPKKYISKKDTAEGLINLLADYIN